MENQARFSADITAGYTFKGETIILGGAIYDGQAFPNLPIHIPLRTLNRHGLISGATGTGKTKTIQVIAEQLSSQGVPVLLMDIKGDLSGIAAPATINSKIEERHAAIGIQFVPGSSPVDFLSLSNEKGARLRATVAEFGPVLFSKILGLNDTQTGVMAVIFKYCDDNKYPLLDLKDVKSVLQFFSNEGKAELQAEYGVISSTSVGAIMRKIVELEQQDADIFFGEQSFEVDDLCRVDKNGKGYISIVRLTDIQDRPKLFSTFMLQMLAEIYSTFPEEGDLDRPKLVLIIDEAHLIFQEASKPLLNQIETIIKLIRSKGVGIFLCTQDPADVPPSVLAQLGLKVQHALRAFTAKDRKNIKIAAENYPLTSYYDTENLLTQMGIGEAFISVLNEKGIPTPLVHTMLRAPQSRMDILTQEEIERIVATSFLVQKYSRVIDRDSAHEILSVKLKAAATTEHKREVEEQVKKAEKLEGSFLGDLLKNPTTRMLGNTIAREVTRGILGVLGLGGRSTTRKR
jgi:DNA helicase HerA-like ATPase